MREISTGNIRPKRLSYAVSLALASLVAGNAALAQDTQTPPAPKKDEAPITKVLVIGTRASQQSSIDRKKNAATAMDSIVAEDVGDLPDRNIGEAISRMSGVALDRGDYGEGVSVAVRGNGADLTRVEIDGQGVQAAGGTDLNGGGEGRGVEFRQLSSDLIKSVDVVKGSTADMTEGSLGGGIIIKTRTGLDFKKPFVSVRVAGSQGSLNKKWSPDLNVILANKYLDGRLGVLLNASSSAVVNEAHSSQVATSGNAGYARAIDFDNSPEKTFSYNPSTVAQNDPASTTPILRSPMLGGGYFDAATPLEIVTKSAAATSKADCYAAFPNLTTDQQNALASGTTRNTAINQRGNELISCLNQWNDYTPSLLRYFVKRQIDRRKDLDLRFDFKVNNELTVYAKGDYNRRVIDDNQLTYNLGGLTVNPKSTTSPTFYGQPWTDSNGVRSAVPNSGYYLYDTPTWVSQAYPTMGSVANVDPSTVVVDKNHHVTQFGISDGNAGTDQIHNIVETDAKYFQAGGTFKRGRLKAEFMVGDAKSNFRRADKRTSFSVNYGPALLNVLPNGLWNYTFPAGSGFNQADPTQYAQVYPATVNTKAVPLSTYNTVAVPAYTIAQQPLLTQAPQLSYSPQIKDTEERTAKLDLTYAMPEGVPFFTRLKSGFNLRDTSGNSWGGGGYIAQAAVGTYGKAGYVPPVVVPRASIRGHFVGCQNTAGSLGTGGFACPDGYVPSADMRYAREGMTYMTPQRFEEIIAASMAQGPTAQFFAGAKDRPAGLLNGWNQIDVEKVFAMVGAPNMNFDCVKECVGSDGKVYQQPVGTFKERTTAGYLMGDFEVDHIPFTARSLPFGITLDGNMGYRWVRTRTKATGQMGFRSIVETENYDPKSPNAAGGTISTTYLKNTSFEAVTTDFMPIYNLSAWLVPDQLVLRYNHAKTVARPPVSRLLPAGTCTYDQRLTDQGDNVDQSCSGTIGNPALQAQKNTNQNLSLEWYPNKDTMFSIATFKQEGKIGPAVKAGKTGVHVFDGTSEVDPATGIPLSTLAFDYSTWINGAATTRKGIEFGSKTAFTFLPWFLRYTGMDLNYTKLRSSTSSANVVDLLTGDPLPPARESKYSYNWAVWYDDGKLSARVAVQAVASFFNFIAANGANTVNNYPNAGGGRTTVLPYNPGSPDFRDATRFIDAKIGYKWKPNVEFFVEGRNLGRATTSNSQGPYSPFADGTPNLLDYAYAGRRIMVGVNFRN
jgi:TonB-dependent receptor